MTPRAYRIEGAKISAMTTIHAHFDGKVFVPESAVSLPTGTRLQLVIEELPPVLAGDESGPFAALAEIAAQFPDNSNSPRDGAAQHDHYLYGTPKRP